MPNERDAKEKRRHSSLVLDGLAQAPSRAMLRAVGFKDEDFTKVQIGIAGGFMGDRIDDDHFRLR